MLNDLLMTMYFCYIKGEFHMKKITMAICIVCIMMLVGCGSKTSILKDSIAGKTFVYEEEGNGSDFTITINEDGTFDYYEGVLSSYLGHGEWKIDDSTLILIDKQSEYEVINQFEIENNHLIWVEDSSDNFIYVKVKDGDKFIAE